MVRRKLVNTGRMQWYCSLCFSCELNMTYGNNFKEMQDLTNK